MSQNLKAVGRVAAIAKRPGRSASARTRRHSNYSRQHLVIVAPLSRSRPNSPQMGCVRMSHHDRAVRKPGTVTLARELKSSESREECGG